MEQRKKWFEELEQWDKALESYEKEPQTDTVVLSRIRYVCSLACKRHVHVCVCACACACAFCVFACLHACVRGCVRCVRGRWGDADDG